MSNDISTIPSTVKTWNDSIEKTIKDIGETSKGYKIIHIMAAKQTENMYNKLMYLNMIVGPITGIIAAASSQNPTTAITALITTFSFISGVVASVIKFSAYREKSIAHKSTASKYTSLESNIRRQLSLSRTDRVSAGPYLEWVSTSFEDLFSSSPLVPAKLYNKWIDYAKQQNMALPVEYGETVEIEHQKKVAELCNIEEISVHTDSKSEVEIVIDDKKKKQELNRNNTLAPVPDMNYFGDASMKYQMSRFMNFS